MPENNTILWISCSLINKILERKKMISEIWTCRNCDNKCLMSAYSASGSTCMLSCFSLVQNSVGPYGLQPSRLLCPWNSPGQNGQAAVPFSRGSLQPKNWTQVSHMAGRFFTSWATREAQAAMITVKYFISRISLLVQWLIGGMGSIPGPRRFHMLCGS